MKTLLMATTNRAKIDQVAGALQPFGVSVLSAADGRTLPRVTEDGNTAEENARKKALAYAEACQARVLSMDNALYLDGLETTDQPGVHVRRVNGRDAVDDEALVEHYTTLIDQLGGRVTGYWLFALCVADPDGKVWETTIKLPRVFVDKPSQSIVPGYPLESIQIDPETGQYVSGMNTEAQAQFWQRTIGKPLAAFVLSIPD